MLTPQHREESLCRAYVQAVTAQAGLNYSLFAYDYGIDIELRSIERVGVHLVDIGVPLSVQLKSTTRATIGEDHVSYDLDAKTYNHLRLSRENWPRILVLLVLPVSDSEWLSQSEDELILRRCAWWISLQGAPTSKAKKTIRIAIPRDNVFSVQGVQQIMKRIQQGEKL